jgi:hypothetical protein
MRQCGDCQLCCKLLPVPPLGKRAGQRCQHQRHHKGCVVYNTKAMPTECKFWSCRWLVENDTADLRRPDRSHYVIDIMPDYLTLRDNDGNDTNVQVVQVWCDPNYEDAHRDPDLRRYLERRAEENIAALIRYDSKRAFAIFAPSMSADRQWHEVQSDGPAEGTHTLADLVRALSPDDAQLVIDDDSAKKDSHEMLQRLPKS